MKAERLSNSHYQNETNDFQFLIWIFWISWLSLGLYNIYLLCSNILTVIISTDLSDHGAFFTKKLPVQNFTNQVKILDENVCVSFHVNTCGKSMNLSVLSAIGLFSLDIVTDLGEGKICTLLKNWLCHILLRAFWIYLALKNPNQNKPITLTLFQWLILECTEAMKSNI